MEYYQRAVRQIADKVAQPHFFVFSDDPEWVRSNLLLDYPVTYVTHNSGDKSFEDLRLMSLCTHHIIANSSFSWWGAWLGRNADKAVIVPNRWFNDFPADTKDLLPSSWLRI